MEARLGRLSMFGGFLGLLIADDLGYSAPSVAGETLDVNHNISVFSVGAGWRLAHSRAERTETRERSVYDGVSKTMIPVAPETLPVELWRLDVLAGGRAIEERARGSDDEGGATVNVATEGVGWGEGFAGLRLEVRPVEGWFFRVGGDAGVVSPADGTTLHGSFVTGIDLGSRVNLVVRAEIWEFDFQEGAKPREEFSGRATAVTLGVEYWW
jgi:hypothetical protein